jgi:polyhydroxyalkanoate synthesis regulator phasin
MMDALKKLISGEGNKEENKKAVVDILVQSGNMTQAEAEQKVDKWEQTVTQTKEQVKQKAKEVMPEVNEKATEVAGKAADVGATAGWFAFIMLLLGAIVSVLGGLIGTPCCCDKRTDKERTVRKVPEP